MVLFMNRPSSTETFDKVRRFYEGPEFANAPVIPGALQGVRALRQMGFRLAIVTARSTSMSSLSERWIAKHFPGESCFSACDIDNLAALLTVFRKTVLKPYIIPETLTSNMSSKQKMAPVV